MEHVVSTTDTIINIAIQVANIALFFFLFIKFAGKTLTDAISEKIEKEKKLADADNKYVSLIAEANAKKEQILADALSHKKSLIIEGESLAKQKREELLAKTNIEIQLLIEKAQKDAQIQKQDMEK
jgi:F0F1-type ATP synthase membrane subunit b/b'